MFDWSDLRVALAVARGGSIAAASRALGVDATTVARRVRALSESLDARLFERRAQGLAPTEAGREVIAAAERMEAESLRLERSASGADARVEGLVRVTTIESFAAAFLSAELAPLAAKYPHLVVELITGDQLLDLSRSEAELAVRYGTRTQEGVVARKIGVVGMGLYASRAHIEAHGQPKTLKQLREFSCIGFDLRLSDVLETRWMGDLLQGRSTVYRSNSTLALVAACVAGAGFALLPCYLARRHPELVEVFGPDQAVRRDISLVMHRELRHVRRVRAVADHIVDSIKAHAAELRG